MRAAIRSTLLGAFVATGCSPSHQATVVTEPPADGAVLPLTMIMELPTVRASVGGQPATLIFDTGGHDTVTLDAEAIKRMGGIVLPGGKRSFSMRAAGQMEFNRGLTITEMDLNGVVLRDIEGHEIEIGGPEELENAVDGYVGFAIVGRFNLLVDEPDRMVLYPAGAPPTGLDFSSWLDVPIDGRLRSTIALAGESLTMIWDTGANHSVIDPDVAQRLFADVKNHVIGDITIAGRVFPQTRLTLHDLSGPGVDVILGTNFFRRHRVFFDFAGGHAWVSPPRD